MERTIFPHPSAIILIPPSAVQTSTAKILASSKNRIPTGRNPFLPQEANTP